MVHAHLQPDSKVKPGDESTFCVGCGGQIQTLRYQYEKTSKISSGGDTAAAAKKTAGYVHVEKHFSAEPHDGAAEFNGPNDLLPCIKQSGSGYMKRNEMDASVRPAGNSFVMHTGPSKLWPACRTVCPLDWMGRNYCA